MEKKSISENIIEIWKKTGKVNVITSSGRCMIPLFDDGTPLIVRYVQPDEIRGGDIAVFQVGDRIVAHRIIGKLRKGGRLYFLEKRDSGFEPGIIEENAIIGKVIGVKGENESINLEKGIWSLTNRVVGFYWLFFCSLAQGMRRLRKRTLREKRILLASRAYALGASLLIRIANLFVSLIRRLSLPRNKL